MAASRSNVIVDGGLVRAETVIVTTGVATAEFKPLRRHFKRRETYLVLTEPLPAAMRKQLGADAVDHARYGLTAAPPATDEGRSPADCRRRIATSRRRVSATRYACSAPVS